MAVDMFLKLGQIKGESRDKQHAGEIDVLAWSWGASNSGSAHVGGGAGSGKVNVQDLSLTKYIDLASTSILKAVSTGEHIDKATLTVRKAGGKPLEYLLIEMDEVLISSISTGGSGGEDRLTENISLNFAKFKIKYVEQKADGSSGGTPDFTYDIAQNAAA